MKKKKVKAASDKKSYDKRLNLKSYKPGQSGNPAGRPPGIKPWAIIFKDEFKAGIISQADLARKMIRVANKGDVQAFKVIADRMDGRPETSFKLDTSQSGESILLGLFQTGAKIRTAEIAEQAEQEEKIN